MHGPAIGTEGAEAGDSPSRAAVAVCMLQSRLEHGRVLPSVLDISGPSQLRSHPGEEFVYVLEGTATIRVGDVEHTLDAGESMAFWGSEPHRYGVAEGSPLPVRLLSLRVNEREGG
jgi:quercetin dioxygenase-like cupin family protein